MAGDVESIVARLGGEAADGETETQRRFVLRTTAAAHGSVLEALSSRPDLSAVNPLTDRELTFSYRGTEEQVAEVVRALASASLPVLGLSEDRQNLEDVFMAVTKGQVQ
jgi:hypothetical protein